MLTGYYLYLVGSQPVPPPVFDLSMAAPPKTEEPSEPSRSLFSTSPIPRQSKHGFWPGIQQPPTRSPHEVGLTEDAKVIGVYVEGRARAYAIAALSRGATSHVINDVIAGRPMSVVYCDVTRCTRVFTTVSSNTPLDLGVGGWEGGKGLILQIRGVNYALEDGENLTSPKGPPLPYQKMPFWQTTWREWRRMHPDTDVYVASRSSTHGG
jgi:hypothetical protein